MRAFTQATFPVACMLRHLQLPDVVHHVTGIKVNGVVAGGTTLSFKTLFDWYEWATVHPGMTYGDYNDFMWGPCGTL